MFKYMVTNINKKYKTNMQKPKSEDKCRKLCGKNMEVLEVEPTKIPV